MIVILGQGESCCRYANEGADYAFNLSNLKNTDPVVILDIPE